MRRMNMLRKQSNAQRVLWEGKIAEALLTEAELIGHLAASLCNSNSQIRHRQRWLLSAFPIKLVEQQGEAFLIHACKPVHGYEVFWNQSYGNSCYHTFPIRIAGTKDLHFWN